MMFSASWLHDVVPRDDPMMKLDFGPDLTMEQRGKE
jgi:hypothetical protein